MEIVLFSVWLAFMVASGIKVYLAQQTLNRFNRVGRV